MLVVEYLLFNKNEKIKCIDKTSFNHLIQSDPNLKVQKEKIFLDDFAAEYVLEAGEVATKKYYFQLTLKAEKEKVEKFSNLLRAIKSIIYLLDSSPQILRDDISLLYANEAYPLIFEVENLMRKLITKFMLVKVGDQWNEMSVPEDISRSLKGNAKDSTHLHNVDFIELSTFLLSENFPERKQQLIEKLKTATDISQLNLDDIKSMIPHSNWTKYFSEILKINKGDLESKWKELYVHRCQVAHNRYFNKASLEKVKELHISFKTILTQAIETLDRIEISEEEKESIVASSPQNRSSLVSVFQGRFRSLRVHLVDRAIYKLGGSFTDHNRNSLQAAKLLTEYGYISNEMFNDYRLLYRTNNALRHENIDLTHAEINELIKTCKMLTAQLEFIDVTSQE